MNQSNANSTIHFTESFLKKWRNKNILHNTEYNIHFNMISRKERKRDGEWVKRTQKFQNMPVHAFFSFALYPSLQSHPPSNEYRKTAKAWKLWQPFSFGMARCNSWLIQKLVLTFLLVFLQKAVKFKSKYIFCLKPYFHDYQNGLDRPYQRKKLTIFMFWLVFCILSNTVKKQTVINQCVLEITTIKTNKKTHAIWSNIISSVL